MYYTKSKREIHFYGEQIKDIAPQNNIIGKIHSLDELFIVLLECWCKETAYPSCQAEYDYDNDPTYGQCAITATLVHDIFGGSIHKVTVSGGGTHYFNKIENQYIDLTSDQFTLYNIPLSYEPNELVPREYCGKNADTLNRFNLLVQRVKNYKC